MVIPEFKDKVITCLDCGEDFTFEVGEQQYFWTKGLSNPKRCKTCRVIRRRSLVNIMESNDNGKAS